MHELIGISMFSSAGIAETYLKDLNIQIKLANELLQERANYYLHFYPQVDMVVGDIMSDAVFSTYMDKAITLNPKFLLATPPCQGMSSLGKKDYVEDYRNYLIFAVLKVIDSLDLDIIIIENVPKFLKLVFPYNGQLLKIIDILRLKYSNKYSRNQQEGDCYRFENILADAFNEFDDVDAHAIGGAGNTDIECIYLTINEKFAIEAKSTQTKLGEINAGRLQLHRDKIRAKYTIIVAPYYKPSAEIDIANTQNIMITASSLSNFLYQSTIHNPHNMSYEPLYKIITQSFGTNITSKVNDYVAKCYGIGRTQQ